MRTFRFLLSASLLLLASCGGGAIAGIIAGSNNGGTGTTPPDVRLPALEIPNNSAPINLLGSDYVFRALTVRNVTLEEPQDPGRVRVVIHDASRSLSQEQRVLSVTNVQSDRFTVSFQVQTASFFAYFAGKPKENVFAKLRVLVDDEVVAPDGDFLLVRPPEIERIVSPSVEGAVEVSADGSSLVTLELASLMARDSTDITMYVFQRNLLVGEGQPDSIRVVQADQRQFEVLERDATTQLIRRARVSVVAPPSKFPGVSALYVNDRQAGWQDLGTPLPLLYAPVLDRLTPNTASVVGGVPAVLLGTALLPARNQTGELEYLLGDVSLTLIKGNARLELDASAIRDDLSTDQQLFFRLPRSPDGLPGEAVLELTLRFDDGRPRQVTKKLGGLGSRAPGARYGVETPRVAHRVTPILRESHQMIRGPFFPSTGVGDDIVLFSRGTEYGQVALQRTAGFGVFREAGRPINVVGQNLRTGRLPLQLLAGRFTGESATSSELFVLSGAGVVSPSAGMHALLQATENIDETFRVVDTQVPATDPVSGGAAVDLNGDGIDEIVVANNPLSGPSVIRIVDASNRSWRSTELTLPAGVSADLLHVADIDADNVSDLVSATATAPFELVVWMGDGRGGFGAPTRISYEPGASFFHANSRAVALESNVDPTHNGRDVFVVVGRSTTTEERQWVVPVRYDPSRFQLVAPLLPDVLELPAQIGSVQCSVMMDVVEGGRQELVLGTSGGASASIVGVDLTLGRPAMLPPHVVPASQDMRNVRQLANVRLWRGSGSEGLLVLHDEIVDELFVPALSSLPKYESRLVDRRTLLDPASATSPQRTLIDDWSQNGKLTDVLIAVPGEIEIHYDRGEGVFGGAPPKRILAPGLIPESVTSAGGANTELVWLETNGDLVHLDLLNDVRTRRDVRGYLEPQNRSGLLHASSRIRAVDYDFDGLMDLCLWLVPGQLGPESTGRIVPLRRDRMATGNVPYFVTAIDEGNRSPASFRGFEVGFLVPHSAEYPGVECALLGPRTVFFFTLFTSPDPTLDRIEYVPGLIPNLHLDSDPSHILFSDLTERGSGAGTPRDLAVLAGGRIRFFQNRSIRSGNSFVGILDALSDLAYPGDPSGLAVADFNGDGLEDVFVLTERGGSNPGPSLCLFAGLGSGSFRSCYVYPTLWQSPSFYASFAHCDFDANGMQDIVLGRDVLYSR